MAAAAKCFIALWKNKPIAFIAILKLPAGKPYYRVSRLVVLPDYQGIGLGKKLLNFIAAKYYRDGHKGFFIVTSNPQLVRHLSEDWKLIRFGHARASHGTYNLRKGFQLSASDRRLTASYKYAPEEE